MKPANEKWQRSIAELLQAKYKLTRGDAIRFSKDFYLVLCVLGKELAKFTSFAERKEISPVVLFYSVAACAKCALSEEEGKPISTGIILCDPVRVGQILCEDMELVLPKQFSIRNWKTLRRLCVYVDGQTAAFIVDKHHGRVKSTKNLQDTDSLVGGAYCDVTSKLSDAAAFFVVRGCKSFRLYSDGEILHQVLVLRKYGEWVSRDLTSCLTTVRNIAAEKGIDPGLIGMVFRLSILISEMSLGASIAVGDDIEIHGLVREEIRLDPPRRISEMSLKQLIRDVTSDGASILGKSGDLQSVGARLLATGGRHASMIDLTKSAPSAMGIVVSEDGVISVITDGKITLEL